TSDRQKGKRLRSLSYGLWSCFKGNKIKAADRFERFGPSVANPAQQLTALFFETLERENQTLSLHVRKFYATWTFDIGRQFLSDDGAIDRSATGTFNDVNCTEVLG